MVDINLVMPRYETPPFKEKRIPLGISYLSASLKQKGYSVRCQDLIFEKLDLNCKYLGVTVPTVCFSEAAKIVKQAKEKGIFTIAGGPHAYMDPKSLLKIGFDAVVIGDGEIALPELLDKVASGEKYSKVITGFVEDLDKIPFPDLGWTERHDFLKSGLTKVIPVLTSRGCPFSCTFCLHVFGRKIRTRSAENIVEEISNYKGTFIEICDDAFTIKGERVLEFTELIRKEKVDIKGFALSNGIRVDTVDRTILKNLVKAGMKNIIYGLESADNSVLRAIKKGVTREIADNAIKITKEFGITPGIFMMIGLPTSTLKSDLNSIDWVKQKGGIYSNWGVTVPYPKTELFDWVEKNGRFLADPKNYYLYAPEAKRPLSFFETHDYTLKERKEALDEAMKIYKVREEPTDSFIKKLKSYIKSVNRIWVKNETFHNNPSA